jgi:hypothetical protein
VLSLDAIFVWLNSYCQLLVSYTVGKRQINVVVSKDAKAKKSNIDFGSDAFRFVPQRGYSPSGVERGFKAPTFSYLPRRKPNFALLLVTLIVGLGSHPTAGLSPNLLHVRQLAFALLPGYRREEEEPESGSMNPHCLRAALQDLIRHLRNQFGLFPITSRTET